LRVVVTFESAKALAQQKEDILKTFWNKDVLTPASVIESMQAMMEQIQSEQGWRSDPQMQSRMRCLAHTKKCWEEWASDGNNGQKKAKFHFSHHETLNTLILTMTSTVPMRSTVYDFFKEESKKPLQRPQAVEPFVGIKLQSTFM
jgi:hypothetical protein